VRTLRLDDPGDAVFLRLPALELDDGRPLRSAAFAVWAGAVGGAVAAGRVFEAEYRARKPLVTALTLLGSGGVAALCAGLLWMWATRPQPAVNVEPPLGDAVLLVLAVVIVLGAIATSAAAALRAWRCRRGTYARVGRGGICVRPGGRDEPLAAIASVAWDRFVGCTRIAFADGRPVLWIPDDSLRGARLDLVLAALDARFAAAYR
jgi:hypothetical protein